VIVGLLLGQPQDLLDPGAQPGQRRSVVLLEQLVAVGQLLLEGVESLLRLAQPTLRIVHPLLGLSPCLLRLVQSGDEPAEVRIHLSAVITTQDDGEVVLGVCALEERER
jgi:hypothetical protein